MSSNFNCNYMELSSSTFLLDFFSKFIPIRHNMRKKSHQNHLLIYFSWNDLWLANFQNYLWHTGTPILYKLLNFRSQIENHVINYRVVGASSFFYFGKKMSELFCSYFYFRQNPVQIRTIFVFLFQRVKPVQILLKSELFFYFRKKPVQILPMSELFLLNMCFGYYLLFIGLHWLSLRICGVDMKYQHHREQVKVIICIV